MKHCPFILFFFHLEFKADFLLQVDILLNNAGITPVTNLHRSQDNLGWRPFYLFQEL
jgi:hypothetical protein